MRLWITFLSVHDRRRYVSCAVYHAPQLTGIQAKRFNKLIRMIGRRKACARYYCPIIMKRESTPPPRPLFGVLFMKATAANENSRRAREEGEVALFRVGHATGPIRAGLFSWAERWLRQRKFLRPLARAESTPILSASP